MKEMIGKSSPINARKPARVKETLLIAEMLASEVYSAGRVPVVYTTFTT